MQYITSCQALVFFFRGGGHSLDVALGDVGDAEAPVVAVDADGDHHLSQLEHVYLPWQVVFYNQGSNERESEHSIVRWS